MAKKERLDLNEFGSKRPVLEQDDLEGGDVAILTVASVEKHTFEDDEGTEKRRMAITFEETGEKVLFCGKTDLTPIVERLGDAPEDWRGEKIVVEKVKRLFRGKSFAKVGVAPAEEWDQYLTPKRERATTPARKKR